MIFCFVDESDKDIERQDKLKVHYFILAGVLIHSDSLFDLSFKLEEFKERYNIENFKDTRKDKGQKFKNNEDLIKELIETLDKYSVKMLSIIEVLNPKQKYDESVREKMYYDAVSFLAERVTLHCFHKKEKWLFIADSVSYKDDLLKELKVKIKEEIREKGRAFSLPIKDYLFETPFFVKDELSNFVQIADLVASAVNGAWKDYLDTYLDNYGMDFVNNNATLRKDVDDLINSKFLKLFWPLFLKSPDGKIGGWGLKIWNFNG
jgi:hypothetical protein